MYFIKEKLMLKTTFNYNDLYRLIKSVLYNSFNLPTNKLTNTYFHKNYIDIEFRKLIFPNFKALNTDDLNELSQTKNNCMGIIKSYMGFKTIVFPFPPTISNDILIIGPFIENEPTNDYIFDLMSKNNLPKNLYKTIITYYRTLPIINSTVVISTLHTILESFISNYDRSSMYYVTFTNHDLVKLTYNNNRDDSEFCVKYYEEYKLYLNDIFNDMKLGNLERASKTLKQYIHFTGLLKDPSIDQLQHNLFYLNTQIETALLQSNIPATFVHKLYTENELQIKNEINRAKLEELPYKILKKYCILSSNYNLQSYSHTVRNAIEYITLNLDRNLSLTQVSETLKKNSSCLSNQFKKETGKTITKYIQEKRIEKSIYLLRNTNLNIQEISFRVGIHDLSWFSKLFKSFIGMSPTQYRAEFLLKNSSEYFYTT